MLADNRWCSDSTAHGPGNLITHLSQNIPEFFTFAVVISVEKHLARSRKASNNETSRAAHELSNGMFHSSTRLATCLVTGVRNRFGIAVINPKSRKIKNDNNAKNYITKNSPYLHISLRTFLYTLNWSNRTFSKTNWLDTDRITNETRMRLVRSLC